MGFLTGRVFEVEQTLDIRPISGFRPIQTPEMPTLPSSDRSRINSPRGQLTEGYEVRSNKAAAALIRLVRCFNWASAEGVV